MYSKLAPTRKFKVIDQNLINPLPDSKKAFYQKEGLVPNFFDAASSPLENFVETSMEDS